jgi:DNA adenine methylase
MGPIIRIAYNMNQNHGTSTENHAASGCTTMRQRFCSPLRYPGGKQKAITKIAKILPQKAREYREPFVGGASVYFHARSINFARQYWINDAFVELISFWQTVQDANACAELRQELEKLRSGFLSSGQIKKYFREARNLEPEDKYQQALLFFFFNRVTFSGTTRAGGFSSAAGKSRFTASSIDRLTIMPEALHGTKITNLGFEEIIETPGEDVFLFLDPPYYTANRLYGRGGRLHEFDHERLAFLLKKSEHRFLITYDDCREIRHLYKWAKIKNWQLQYGMNNCNEKRTSKIGAELFVSNY